MRRREAKHPSLAGLSRVDFHHLQGSDKQAKVLKAASVNAKSDRAGSEAAPPVVLRDGRRGGAQSGVFGRAKPKFAGPLPCRLAFS